MAQFPRNTTDQNAMLPTLGFGLLALRVVTGLVFFMHGYQKLFDSGIAATQAGFNAMGAPLPDITAVIVTFVELIGGLALMAGILTPIVGALLAIDMVGAFFITHVENGFFAANGGFELVLILGAAAFALVLTGPGSFALDSLVSLPGRAQNAFSVRQPERG